MRRALALLVLAACSSGTISANRTGTTTGPPTTAGTSSSVASVSAATSTEATVTAEPTTAAPTSSALEPTTTSTPTTVAPPTTIASLPSSERPFTKIRTITGDISPKSVSANGTGLVTAQNMMYRHTMTVYDAATGKLRATIADRVDLAELGAGTGIVRGAPVEASPSPDGLHTYVSNYSMYGPGFDAPGDDVCSPSSGIDHSYLYRVDLTNSVIDQAIAVGSVPKFVATTPDGTRVLVSNWCSYDLSVIDTATATEITRLEIGRYPRGIAITADGSTAYVAAMGTRDVAVVDLATYAVNWIRQVGSGPRHLVLSPDGASLYVTLNADGTVARVDLGSGKVVARIRTGQAPRSMTISPDGSALFVVNYESDTVAKIRTSDMAVIDSAPTAHHPIGITYEPTTSSVWVACYSGRITVFNDAP